MSKENDLLHGPLEKWARLTPDRVAVVFNKQQVTYDLLNKRSDCLASYFLRLGLKNEEFVLVMLDKSVEMVISLYAILKAGGAYIPLDVDFTVERVGHVLRHASPKIIVTHKKYSAKFEGHATKSEIIYVEEFQFNDSYRKRLPIKIDPSQLAYAIFTSGTTGKPKGVTIKHEGIVNTISSLSAKYYISAKSRILQFSNLAFDSSVIEIFGAHYMGGVLVLASTSELRNVDKLSALLKEKKITVATFPPALLENMDFTDNRYLQTLVSAGENCPVKLANKLYKQVPHFINAYGPTECSVCVTTYEVRSNLTDVVPIGKPIAGMNIFLLDKNLEKVSKGQEGEIYISGVGIARNYLQNSKETKRSFISSPFKKSEVLYKTNDVGVLLENDNYAFLRRSDLQIKIRGQRVELEEIEKHLRDLEGIISVAVAVNRDQKNRSTINCYYTSRKEIDSAIFRSYLKERVPAYMIPNYFIRLEQMPLNINGKLDRAKLLSFKRLSKDKPILIYPEEENARKIRDIWINIFDTDRIGMNDNFFDLGGDSLLAMRLIAEVNSKLNVDIDIVNIFEFPKLSDFVKIVVDARKIERYVTSPAKKESKYYPVSDTQKMFWFAYKLDSRSTANNITEVLDIKGKIDIQSLNKSLDYITKKHEAIRTNIVERDGLPFQKVNEKVNNMVDVINIKRSNEVDKEVHKLSNRLFRLEAGTLMNATLLRIRTNENKLVFTMHHIISDALSFDILLADFFKAYDSLINNKSIEGDQLAKGYKDYALIEQEEDYQFKLKRMEEFWMKYLDGSISLVNLPTDYSKINAPTSSGGGVVEKRLNSGVLIGLQRIAKKEEVTQYMLLFGAFNVFMHRISDQEDIVIGTPVSVRSKEFENSVGPFINTIAVRSTLRNNIPFSDYLQEQKNNFLSVFKNKEYAFNKIVERLHPNRDYGGNPIFNIMFDYLKEGGSLPTIDGVSYNRKVYDNHTSKFDLTMTVNETAQGELMIKAEYRTDLFRQKTIERIVNNFQVFLESISLNYKAKISELKIISREEETIIKQFNNTDHQFSKKPYIRIFEEQVRNNTDKVGVKFGDEIITYGELNQRANQLARHLLALKVNIDVPVGVLLERSIDLVVSIIAIWKAGGSYVPLEPEYPIKQIDEMVNGSELKCIITKSEYHHLISKKGLALDIDQIQNTLGKLDDHNLRKHYPDSSLAYIIFTSGSTQKPKGVMIEHKGMMNHIFALIDYCKLTSKSIIAQNASHCFDISVWQLVCSLLVGGQTVIYPKGVIMEPALFLEKMQKDGVTILEAVPSFINVLLEIVESGGSKNYTLNDLRYLLTTGEVVKPILINRWFKAYPHVEVVNVYGPAEASDDTNLYLMKKPPADIVTSIPVGRPIENVKTYVLDKYLNLCPIGVYGEICISGIAVGRGYINNPSKTREVFITDPISKKTGVRLYKTGDIGRWREDGNIEFIGRKDFQVKIRGFRIELGAIEQRLSEHISVKEVVVIDWEDENEDKHLVSYYTSDGDISSQDLKSFLLEKLPYYMVPSFFIRLPSIPTNNSGKVDRASLPRPRNTNEKSKTDFELMSEKERAIGDVWKKILKIGHAKPTDNFFELGGDSIQSIQAVSMLKEMGYRLVVKDIFLHQTIRDLAKNMDLSRKRKAIGSLHGKFSLTPIQADFFSHGFYNTNDYNQAFSFDLEAVDMKILSQSLRYLQEYHDALRLRFHVNGDLTQEYASKAIDILSFYDLSSESNYKNRILSLSKRLSRDLNIKNGPLVRAALFKLSRGFKFTLIAHHLVVDIFSWRLIINDLEDIYTKIKSKESIDLPEKRSSYKDWAERLVKYANSKRIDKQIPVWNKICAEIKTIIPQNVKGKIKPEKKMIRQTLGRNYKQLIEKEASITRTRPDVVVLTSVIRALKKYAKANSIPIFLENNGRAELFEEIDTSRTVGWFTSLYPVVFENLKGSNFLKDIKSLESTIASIPDNGASYGAIKYLRKRPDATNIKSAQEPQIIFNYLGEITTSNSNKLFKNASIENLTDTEGKALNQIEIDSYTSKDKLEIEVRYPINVYSKALVSGLIRQIRAELDKLFGEPASRPPDIGNQFDLVNLDKDRFNKIYSKFKHE